MSESLTKEEQYREVKNVKLKVNILNIVFFGIAIYKIIIGFLKHTYLIFGGISTILFCAAKILIVKHIGNENSDFKKDNKKICFLFLLSGIVYAFSMGYVLFGPENVKEYELWVGIVCTIFAVVESALTISEIVLSESYGKYFRDLRNIDIFECFEACVLALIAFMLMGNVDLETITIYAGSAGFSVGILEIITAFILFVVPRFSVIDEPEIFFPAPTYLQHKKFSVRLIKNRFLGDFNFEGFAKYKIVYGKFVDNEPKKVPLPAKIIAWLTFYIWTIPYLLICAVYFIQTLGAKRKLLHILNNPEQHKIQIEE